MIPTKTRQCQRVPGPAGRRISYALGASIAALILTAAGAPAAFAVPAAYPAEGPSAGATTTPGAHHSMPGMDPDMPGMSHDETPGVDPDMPGMSHDETPGMDPDMPGMSHDETPGMDPDMPGMSHDETPGMDPDMPGMSHDETPGMDPDMPGMSHDETPGMDPDMPGMSESGTGHPHAATAGPDTRPQAAVVGTFAALNGGVLVTAGLMRRRAKRTALKPSRASRPAK